MDYKTFLKDGVSVFGNQLSILFISFTSGIILARMLGPEGKGIYSSLLVYPTILISLLSLGIRQSAAHFIGSKKYLEVDIIGAMLLLLIVMSSIGLCAVVTILLQLNNSNFDIILISLIALTIPADLTINYLTGIYIGKKQISKFNKIMSSIPLINLLLIILLVYFGGFHVTGAVLALVIGKIVIAGYALYLSKQQYSLKINFIPDLIRKMLSLGGRYSVSLFILSINYQVDIVILERLSNATEIGQYTIGVGIAQLLWQLPTALGLVVFSYSTNESNGKEFSQSVAKMIRISLPIVLAVAVILYYISDYIVPIIYGEDFIPSVNMLKILLPGIVIMSFFKILNMDIAGKGKPEISLIAFFPAALINIILNVILIPDYGGCGAAFASTISYSTASIFFLIIYSKMNSLSLNEILICKKDDIGLILKVILGLRRKKT